jgi:ribonuclease-3
VHLDAGFDAAQALVHPHFGAQIAGSEAAQWSKDAKTELQETLQARRLPVPAYRIRATRGQAHAQVFEVECEVTPLGLVEAAEGRSRRAAEQEAARRMLARLKAPPGAQPAPVARSMDHGR